MEGRNTHFDEDRDIYGPIGENDLVRILRKSPKITAAIDVTGVEEYQGKDIDVISEGESGKIVTYEVKTDTRGLKTRNITYEMYSNGNEGCLIRSKCDYVYYVFLDGTSIKERYLINRKELNWWIMLNFGQINNCSVLRSVYMEKPSGDRTGLLLINIDSLVRDPKIARKL